MTWINNIKNNESSVCSQGGHDGVIDFIFKNIGTTNRFCVEFGFNSKVFKYGSNTAKLVIQNGWRCLLLDRMYKNPLINLHKVFITPENVCDIFKTFGCTKNPDYISIDIDSVDLWVFKALLASSDYRSRLFSVEYNSNFKLEESFTVKPGTSWENGDCVYGASLFALKTVAEEFGYCLIHAVKPFDLFFISRELVEEVPPIEYFSDSVGIKMHKDASRSRMMQFVKYPSMEEYV